METRGDGGSLGAVREARRRLAEADDVARDLVPARQLQGCIDAKARIYNDLRIAVGALREIVVHGRGHAWDVAMDALDRIQSEVPSS